MSIASLITFIVLLLVLGLLFTLAWWVLGQFAIPEPINKVVRIVLVVVFTLALIILLLNFAQGDLPTIKGSLR